MSFEAPVPDKLVLGERPPVGVVAEPQIADASASLATVPTQATDTPVIDDVATVVASADDPLEDDVAKAPRDDAAAPAAVIPAALLPTAPSDQPPPQAASDAADAALSGTITTTLPAIPAKDDASPAPKNTAQPVTSNAAVTIPIEAESAVSTSIMPATDTTQLATKAPVSTADPPGPQQADQSGLPPANLPELQQADQPESQQADEPEPTQAASGEAATPVVINAPKADLLQRPGTAPTRVHARHQPATAVATPATTQAGADASDDAPPVSGTERRGRAPTGHNPAAADTADEAPAKPNGRAIVHLAASLDEPAAIAKRPFMDAVQATGTPHAPELIVPAPGAVAPTTPTASALPVANAVPVPITGLAVEIAARAQPWHNRFEIRLDPPELGRIDVRLDVDTGGNVTSRLVVERAETLDLLQRDAGDLQRALQDAGLKTSDNGLQFALRDQSFAGRQDRGSNPSHPFARVIDPDASVHQSLPDHGRAVRRGLDIRV